MSDKLQVTSDKTGDKSSDKLQVTSDKLVGYRKLRVWQIADRLAHEVYRITKNFPHTEQYGLVSQLRRAAVSVATNLVEGQARKGKREFKQFVATALGSLAEVEYLLEFSRAEGFLSEGDYRAGESLRREAGKLLWSLYESL